MKKTNPIGFFDSGVGGTSIWKEMIQLLPHENTLFLADSIHAPYGLKPRDEIIALSEKNTEFLLENNAKLIVVACNTATTNAISHLRAKYAVPFIGIEPAIKPAALQSQTKRIGILATKGTLSSALFAQTSGTFTKGVQLIEQEGIGLVELIESGKKDTDAMQDLLRKYLQPMLAQHIDHLILGCTHYPYLIPNIQKIIGDNPVKIIDSGFAVSKQILRVLKQQQLLNNTPQKPSYRFYTNSDTAVLKDLLQDVPVQIHIEKKAF